MEFKGSKSPWNYNGNYCGTVEGSTEDMVACAYPMHYENAEKMKANAHLISAAPGLLEALQRLLKYHDDFYGTEQDEDPEHPLAIAKSAIAKALGQQ